MKKKLISGVVGLAMIMSISTTAMAAEIPKESKEIKSGIVKEVEIKELVNCEDLNGNGDILVSIATNDVDNLYNSTSYSTDILDDIFDKLKLNTSEKESILKKNKANEVIENKICKLFEESSNLSDKDFTKKLEALEKGITPLFNDKQMKKIKELKLFPEFEISENVINIDGKEFLNGDISAEILTSADDIDVTKDICVIQDIKNTK